MAILQGIITQSTGQARAEGSKKGLTACGLMVVAEQPADWDTAKAQSAMENIITGHPNLKAVFASNDNMALGVVQALKSAKMLDKVMVVGFDANPNAAASILAGEMSASVAQNPEEHGRVSASRTRSRSSGEKIDPVLDTGTVLVTKDNAEKFKYARTLTSSEQARPAPARSAAGCACATRHAPCELDHRAVARAPLNWPAR